MHKQIYVNLPVRDLPRAKAFFAELGFTFEPRFTNDDAAAMIVGDNIFAMLLVQPYFEGFAGKPACDTARSAEVLVCLSCESREEVDDLMRRAVAAGGSTPRAPQDHGFMYQGGFADPDGHIWELVYMEPGAADERAA